MKTFSKIHREEAENVKVLALFTMSYADKHHLTEHFQSLCVVLFHIHKKLLTLPLGKHSAENA